MDVGVDFQYINGSFTVITIDSCNNHKTVVFDCGSSFWNWGIHLLECLKNTNIYKCDNPYCSSEAKKVQSISFNYNKGENYIKTLGDDDDLPLGYDDSKEKRDKLTYSFKRLYDIRPDIIIVSHAHTDHYNLIPLMNLECLEKIICYKPSPCFKEWLNVFSDVIDMADYKTNSLSELLNDPIYDSIKIYSVDYNEFGRNYEDDTGLICVVHGNNNIFMPGDASPGVWTKEVFNELIECKYIFLPHHGCNQISIGKIEIPVINDKNAILFVNQGTFIDETQRPFIKSILGITDERIEDYLISNNYYKVDEFYNNLENIFYIEKYGEAYENYFSYPRIRIIL